MTQMNIKLKVWRQDGPNVKGHLEEIEAKNISQDCSFLEMLDQVNESLEKQGKRPIAFDHDCREGICGSCALMINGIAHGPEKATTSCQLHMRHFKDGDTIVIEPWRAKAFPIIKDLAVDRSAFDRVIRAGGYISISTGQAADADSILVPKKNADEAFNSAACIACGACVAQCKNASANLFVSAKIRHLNLLPQGQPEAKTRALAMVAQADQEGFGACSWTKDCEAVCPKEIKVTNISYMFREFNKASIAK